MDNECAKFATRDEWFKSLRKTTPALEANLAHLFCAIASSLLWTRGVNMLRCMCWVEQSGSSSGS